MILPGPSAPFSRRAGGVTSGSPSALPLPPPPVTCWLSLLVRLGLPAAASRACTGCCVAPPPDTSPPSPCGCLVLRCDTGSPSTPLLHLHPSGTLRLPAPPSPCTSGCRIHLPSRLPPPSWTCHLPPPRARSPCPGFAHPRLPPTEPAAPLPGRHPRLHSRPFVTPGPPPSSFLLRPGPATCRLLASRPRVPDLRVPCSCLCNHTKSVRLDSILVV